MCDINATRPVRWYTQQKEKSKVVKYHHPFTHPPIFPHPVNVFRYFPYETERQGPDNQFGQIKVRGPIDLCGPKVPLPFFVIPVKNLKPVLK